VTVRPGATAVEAARLMDWHQVGCLLVVDEAGKLLGMISPRDLLRGFLRPDEEIRAEVVNEILAGYLGTNPAMVQVGVTGGVVRLAGELERKSMLELVLPAVRAVDGVVDAESHLGYAIDDTRAPHRPVHDKPETPSSPVAARRLT
jgi:CBS domain-containing protein